MIKTILSYVIVFGLFLGCGSAIHLFWLGEEGDTLIFSIIHVYLFHAIFALLLCIFIYRLSNSVKWQAQLGFLYLGALVFKLVSFSVIFSQSLFEQEFLSLTERFSLLIPALLFLIPEAYFISKILMKIDPVKK